MVEATLKGILYSVVKVRTLTSGYGVEGIRDIHGQIATAPARHTTIPAFAGMPPPRLVGRIHWLARRRVTPFDQETSASP